MKDANELLYWAALAASALAFLTWRRRRKSDSREFKEGEAEAKRLLKAGVFPAAILSYIEVQRSRGMSGPYEMGLKKALSKAEVE
jgi:hypothetical protein